MNTDIVENHFQWRVQVGKRLAGDPSRLFQTSYYTSGYGCMVHQRIVLTTYEAWEETQDYTGQYRPALIVNGTKIDCELGWGDADHNIAFLVVRSAFKDTEGRTIEDFPSFSTQDVVLGKTVGTLCDIGVYEYPDTRLESDRSGGYVYFTRGCVSVARGEDKTFFVISGAISATDCAGGAIFDETGSIIGVTTRYFRPMNQTRDHVKLGGTTTPCLIVFTPTVVASGPFKDLKKKTNRELEG
jgi:hypothetical protein